jgi:hypothetical protein
MAAIELQRPTFQAGDTARNKLLDLLGLSDRTGAAGYGSLNTQFKFDGSNLESDPGYQFQREQGQNALDRKAAAGGGFYSGAALQDASRLNQGLASTAFDSAYQRQFNEFQTNRANTLNPLQSLSGAGQTAATTAGQLGVNGANVLAGLITSNGNAQGAAQIAQGNALASGINNGLSAWQRSQYLDRLTQTPQPTSPDYLSYFPGGRP